MSAYALGLVMGRTFRSPFEKLLMIYLADQVRDLGQSVPVDWGEAEAFCGFETSRTRASLVRSGILERCLDGEWYIHFEVVDRLPDNSSETVREGRRA